MSRYIDVDGFSTAAVFCCAETQKMSCGDVRKFIETAEKVFNSMPSISEGAFEKQMPKKPIYVNNGTDVDGSLYYTTWICPCCKEHYDLDYDDFKFCPNCGQAIDWSNDDDVS